MASAPSSSADGEARLIDGRAIAERITGRVAFEARRLKAEAGLVPGLAVVLVGTDPASQTYVAGKSRRAEEVGFHSVQHTLPEETREATLLGLVDRLNHDPAIHGILVQLPLPSHIDKVRVIEAVRPDKDVDGFHPLNAGKLASGLGAPLVPCTPAGCMILIRHVLGADISGRTAVVIGRSTIVGRPMAHLLVNADCTVTVAHSRTRALADVVRGGEIVVAAAGRPEMVRGDWIRPGAVVIDVGINRLPAPERGQGRFRLAGDVAFAEARRVAGAITPVPGGVGPMTIAMLMANTLTAACRQNGLPVPDISP
jgi:methylenetetrahydrofolate dehydrogenase (NADP+)/methenyltetrahydrofolate cyclohydrolase